MKILVRPQNFRISLPTLGKLDSKAGVSNSFGPAGQIDHGASHGPDPVCRP